MKKLKYSAKNKPSKVVKVAKKRRFAKVKRFYGKHKSNFGLVGEILGAGVYGAIRSKAADSLKPVTDKLPLGNISDEVLLGATAILLKKTLGRKMPMLNPVLNGAIIIESARIGEAVVNGQTGIGQTVSSQSQMQTQSGYLYG